MLRSIFYIKTYTFKLERRQETFFQYNTALKFYKILKGFFEHDKILLHVLSI